MKKTVTIGISILAAAVIAMTVLVGCGAPGLSAAGGTVPASLAGTSWIPVSQTDHTTGQTYYASAGEETVITFGDGTVIVYWGSDFDYASYTYENGYLIIYDEFATYSGWVQGDTMTLEASGNGVSSTVVYRRR